jgi:hypothetical protein
VRNPRDLIACATLGCVHCNGTGVRLAGCEKIEAVCPCCYRQIARIVLARVRMYSSTSGHTIRCNMTQFARGSNRIGRRENGRKAEELCADAFLIAKRTLSPLEFDIYRRHFLAGAPWFKFPTVDRGNFFHACYRIEQKLGDQYANLEPYPLFPLDAYMSSDHALNRQADVRPCTLPAPVHPNGLPLRPPLAAPAQPVRAVQPTRTPAVVVTMPAPAVPDDIYTAEDHIKRKFREGVGLGSIADSLAKHGFTPPNGKKWVASDVKRILMAKRAA